jgi:hypothetical protein
MPPAARRINKILHTTSAENALLLILNSGSDRGWGLQLNSRIITAMGYKQSPSTAAIWILTLL